jgi:hypothetical protein
MYCSAHSSNVAARAALTFACVRSPRRLSIGSIPLSNSLRQALASSLASDRLTSRAGPSPIWRSLPSRSKRNSHERVPDAETRR